MLAPLAALLTLLGPPGIPPIERSAELVEIDDEGGGSAGTTESQIAGDAHAPGSDAAGSSSSSSASATSSSSATSSASATSSSSATSPPTAADDAADDGWDFDFDALGAGFGDDADLPRPEPAAGAGAAAKAPVPASSSGDAPAAADTAKKRRVDLDKIFGGSLRLTGAYLHFDDEPAIFPAGDDALGLALGRVTVDAPAGDHVTFSVNGFVELSRSPLGTLGGAFASAGATESAYRTRYLSWNFWENGAVRGTLGLDRAAMSVHHGPLKIDVGRFPINYTVTNLYAPNDFYAPFSATAVNRLYKPGVDALRVSLAAGRLATVDVVGVLGYGDDGVPTWGRSSVLTRAGFVGGGFEWGVLGGKVSERWVVGGSAQGDAGPIGLRGEFHVGFPDRDGKGRGQGDLPIYVRAAGGPNVGFAWRNTLLSAEYMLISDGATRPADYLARAGRLYTDTVPYFARHYVSATFGLDLVPILKAATFAVVNANDGSGLAGASLFYNLADESDLILGVFAPWGRGVGGIDPLTMLPALGSEYGLSPLVVYLEARAFF